MKCKCLIVVASCLLLFSCFVNDENNNSPSLKSEKTGSEALIGVWSTLCLSKNGYSYNAEFTFSKSETSSSLSYAYVEKRYLDSDECSGSFAEINQEGVYTIGSLFPTSSGVDAIEINFYYLDESIGSDVEVYNILSISDESLILYLGEPGNSIPNRPKDLDYDTPFFSGSTPKTLVTFFNDLSFPVTEITIKLSSVLPSVKGANKIDSPIETGASITLSILCGEKFDITIKSAIGVVEQRTNVQLFCSKNYSWPIDGQ